jgi:hypothetical protein
VLVGEDGMGLTAAHHPRRPMLIGLLRPAMTGRHASTAPDGLGASSGVPESGH